MITSFDLNFDDFFSVKVYYYTANNRANKNPLGIFVPLKLKRFERAKNIMHTMKYLHAHTCTQKHHIFMMNSKNVVFEKKKI
jgi:hypothetical protein